MPDRRLLLHAGMPKTGTSALQAAFARNERLLESAGVHHPEGGAHRRALRGKVTAGNAGPLTPWLRATEQEPPEPVEEWLDAVLAAAPSDAARVLVSSETCFYADPGRLAQLRELLARRETGLEVLVLVRDAVPWTVSTYAQHVQRAGFAGSLDGWLQRFQHVYADWQKRLTTFAEVVGSERLRVVHYDSHRRDLVAHVVGEVLGLDDLTALRQDAPVNRTLGARELAWMREVNVRLAEEPDRARAVGNVLLKGDPLPGDEPLRAGPETAARIAELAAPHVAWVNETFFEGAPVLGTGTDAAGSRTTEVVLDDGERAALEVAVRMARNLPRSSQVDAEVAELRGRLQQERRRRRAAERQLRWAESRTDPDGAATAASTPPAPEPRRRLIGGRRVKP